MIYESCKRCVVYCSADEVARLAGEFEACTLAREH